MKGWLKFAFAMDVIRLWPRAFCTAYFIGGGFVLRAWLSEHTTWSQDGFTAIYAGLCIPMLKWYMENGTDYAQLYPLIFKGYRKNFAAAPRASTTTISSTTSTAAVPEAVHG